MRFFRNLHNYKNTHMKRVYSCIGTVIGSAFIYICWKESTLKRKNQSILKTKHVRRYKDPYFGSMVELDGHVLPKLVFDSMNDIISFPVRSNDIFVVTFPKSETSFATFPILFMDFPERTIKGTTWVQEMIYLICTDLDFATAKTVKIDDRFPFLEYPCPGLKAISHSSSPRFIKTHLPISLLPSEINEKKPKIVYVARNPKDVSVSYYHFCRSLSFVSFKGTFTEFFETFLEGTVPYGPWWKHVNDAWCEKEETNILFITYEELQKDVVSTIRKIANFLERPLKDADVLKIAHHCCFKNMQQNSSVNYVWMGDLGLMEQNEMPFMRKGIVGDWKNYYSTKMKDEMHDYVVMNMENNLIRQFPDSTIDVNETNKS